MDEWMSDLISRKAAIAAICRDEGCGTPCETKCITVRAVQNVSGVDAAPVVHGKWIHRGMDIAEHPWRCSVCNWGNRHIDKYVPEFDRCPQCGANMNKED